MDERMTLADDAANEADAAGDQRVAGAGRPAAEAARSTGGAAVGEAARPATEAATSTGDAAVDEALTLLNGLDEQPLRAHVAAFDAVHGALQDRLADAEG